MAGLYIHVPFCKQRCIYCDFFSGTNLSITQHYLRAVSLEMDRYKDFFDSNILNTIYLGGGTPSLLSISDLAFLLEEVSRRWQLSNLEEMTIECNPDDLSYDYLCGLRALGFNRLSIGLQSMDDRMLMWMNRRHTVKQSIEAICEAKRAGFDNISVDIIFGLPNQDVDHLNQTVDEIIKLDVQHISAYSLTVESKRLIMLVEQNQLKLPSDDEYVAMFDLIYSSLADAGFMQYEISNYALPGFQSKHNSAYWDGTPYLGLGPAASSFDGRCRWTNLSHTIRYCSKILNAESVAEREYLSDIERLNERIFLSLRTLQGVQLQCLKDEFGNDKVDRLLCLAKKYVDSGHLVLDQDKLHLSHKGVFVSDMIMSDLMF